MFVDCLIHTFLKEGKLHGTCKILISTKGTNTDEKSHQDHPDTCFVQVLTNVCLP